MPETMQIPTSLGPLSVTRHGASRPPLVLWHSLFVDGRSWDPVLPPLIERRTVLVIDGPGHGASPGPSRRYGIDACAEAAVEVLDHLGIAAVDWIGNAWGGHVGTALAALHPARVSSLVAIGAPMEALRGAARVKSRFLVAMVGLLGWRRWLLDLLVDALVDPAVRVAEPAIARYVVEAVTAPGKARMLLAMHSVMMGRRSQVERLPRIAAPTLFVSGDRDPMWPVETARAEAARIPGGSVTVVEGCRHLPPLEAPAEVAATLGAWLDARDRR